MKATEELLAAIAVHESNTLECQKANALKAKNDSAWEASASRVSKAQASVQADLEALASERGKVLLERSPLTVADIAPLTPQQ